MAAEVLERLRELVAQEGGLISTLLARADGHPGPPAAQFSPAAALDGGPRTASRSEEYELLVEAIYEGYLLHYGCPRVMHSAEADLALLAGDRLYALGLARLVALGDTLAVAELADTITLCSLAHGGGNAALAQAVWAAGVTAVGWGATEQHRQAKQLVLAGSPLALDAMRTCALQRPARR
jgi:hypothetical protein